MDVTAVSFCSYLTRFTRFTRNMYVYCNCSNDSYSIIINTYAKGQFFQFIMINNHPFERFTPIIRLIEN